MFEREKISGEEFAQIMSEDYVYVEETDTPAEEKPAETVENTEVIAEVAETSEAVEAAVEETAEPVAEVTAEETTEKTE